MFLTCPPLQNHLLALGQLWAMLRRRIFQNGGRSKITNIVNGKYLENEKYFCYQYSFIKVEELYYKSIKKIILKIGPLLSEIGPLTL